MSSFRPEPRPRSKSKQKKYVRGGSGGDNVSPIKKRDGGIKSERTFKLISDYDNGVNNEAYYPETTSERLLFHRDKKRSLGTIEKTTQLNHFHRTITKQGQSQQSSQPETKDSNAWNSELFYESSISQRELDSMSIAESILTSEINRNVLEIILECLSPLEQSGNKHTQSAREGHSISSPQLGSEEAEEEIRQRQANQTLFNINFSCVPATIQSLQQDYQHKIKQELSEITKPEPRRPSKLSDTISQKVKAMDERAKEAQLRQLSMQPPPPPPQQMVLEVTHREKTAVDTNVHIPEHIHEPPFEKVDKLEEVAEKKKHRKQVAVIEEMTKEDRDDDELMSWQKEVILPVTYGVSLGMVLDIIENNAVIVGFREVSPGVRGAAEASKRIDVGDMLLAINDHPLQNMQFDDIVSFVKSITISRHRQVVLLLGITEYIHAEMNKGMTLSEFLSQEEGHDDSEDPFCFLGGVGSSEPIQHNEETNENSMSQYCSFPGDLALNVDPVELERRFQFMFQESRKLRTIRAEGFGYGYYDNAKQISPLFSASSHKTYVVSSSALTSIQEYEIKFKHDQDEEDPLADMKQSVLKIESDESFQHREEVQSEVFSGGVDTLGTPWGLPLMDNLTQNRNRNNTATMKKDWKKPIPLGYDVKCSTPSKPTQKNKFSSKLKETSMTELFDTESLKDHSVEDTSNEPFGSLVQEVVELDDTLMELELQLQFYIRLKGEQVVIPDELHALFIELNEKRKIQEEKAQEGNDDLTIDNNIQEGTISETEVGKVVHLILSTMSSIDLSERWCNPLDAWPPRRLTLTVASYIGFHIRDAVNKDSFITIESTLMLFLNLTRSPWLAEAKEAASPPRFTSSYTESSPTSGGSGGLGPHGEFLLPPPPPPLPSLRCATTLVDPKDLLHRNLICDLTTLYFQIRSVGWKKLSFLKSNTHHKNADDPIQSRGYFWDLEVNFNTVLSPKEIDEDVKVGVLWSEDRAREFVNTHSDFLRLNECISCAGARKWLAITAQLVDLASSKECSEGRQVRDASQCVASILKQYSHVTKLNEMSCESREVSNNRGVTEQLMHPQNDETQSQQQSMSDTRFFKPKSGASNYDLLSTSHEESLQLLEALFKHCRLHMEGYYALLLEVGQILWKFDTQFASRLFSECFPHLSPWHVWTLLKSAHGPLSFSECDVGIKVSVWRQHANNYLNGSIIDYALGVGYGVHSVKFEKTGVVEVLDMTEECYEVFEADSQTKLYISAVGQIDPLTDPLEADDLNSPREHNVWWFAKVSYHSYLNSLLVRSAPLYNKEAMEVKVMPSKGGVSNFDELICEFVELSLLLASDLGNHITRDGLKILDSSKVSDKTSQDSLRMVKYGAYQEALHRNSSDSNGGGGGGKSDECSNSTSSERELLRYALSLGRSAKEERISNTMIYAKQIPLFEIFSQHRNDRGKELLTDEIEREGVGQVARLDFEAWLFRIMIHSDYTFLKESELALSLVGNQEPTVSNDRMHALRQRWIDTGRAKPNFRYTDQKDCHVDISKLQSMLQQYSIMSNEYGSFGASTAQQGANTHSQAVVCYRSAWGKCKNMQDVVVSNLQEAWNNVLRTAPAVLEPLIHPSDYLSSLDSMIKHLSTTRRPNKTLLLSLALICQRYGHWDGVLTICESLINLEISNAQTEHGRKSSSSRLALSIYELIRLSMIGTLEIEMNNVYGELINTRILKSLFLTSVLYECYTFSQSKQVSELHVTDSTGDDGDDYLLFNNRIPCHHSNTNGEKIEESSMRPSDRLVLGMVIDAINVYHCYHKESAFSEGLALFYNSIINALVEVLGMLRAVAVVGELQHFVSNPYNISFGDMLLRRGFEFETRQQELVSNAHRNLSYYHASLYSNTTDDPEAFKQSSIGATDEVAKGWGCVLGEDDVCSLCSLPLTEVMKGFPSSTRLEVSAFRCGHVFHSSCLEFDECFLCEIHFQSEDSLF